MVVKVSFPSLLPLSSLFSATSYIHLSSPSSTPFFLDFFEDVSVNFDFFEDVSVKVRRGAHIVDDTVEIMGGWQPARWRQVKALAT